LETIIQPIKEVGYHTFSNKNGALDPSVAKNPSIMIFDDDELAKKRQQKVLFLYGSILIYVNLKHTYRNI